MGACGCLCQSWPPLQGTAFSGGMHPRPARLGGSTNSRTCGSSKTGGLLSGGPASGPWGRRPGGSDPPGQLAGELSKALTLDVVHEPQRWVRSAPELERLGGKGEILA